MEGRVAGMKRGVVGLVRCVLVAGAGLAAAPECGAAQDPGPQRVIDRAFAVMGGESVVRGVETAAMSMMTAWQRTHLLGLPAGDRPSYERHYDVRDYRIPAWRNTRDFGARRIVNIVRDSVATTDFGGGPQPLSIAYVDERNELFTYTPDRLLVAIADAPDLRSGPDTTIAGLTYHRLVGRLNGRYDAEVFFQAASGALAGLRFRAGHPNDFGLVQWGAMDVGVWYANWRAFGDLSIPTQWDVSRVGVPYKRMTVLNATYGAEFAADSFAVSDESRDAYLRTQTAPMHESRPLAPITLGADGLTEGGGFGFPIAAVDTGDGWTVIDAGQGPSSFTIFAEALSAAGGTPVVRVLAARASAAGGGVVGAVEADVAVHTSPSAAPYVREILRAHDRPTDVTVHRDPARLGIGSDALEVVPFPLPDAPESILAFHERSGWLYAPDVAGSFGIRLALDAARRRGWTVTRLGTARSFSVEVPGGG